MSKEKKKKSKLNVNIDPALLLSLQSEAIKEGKTLTEFVTEKLKQSPIETSKDLHSLEARLLTIEKLLGLDKKPLKKKNNLAAIFTDEGAKNYGEVAKAEFESQVKKKGLTVEDGLKELLIELQKTPDSIPELVFSILLGTHDLTGVEMTAAYRRGSCAMRTALVKWSNDPLEKLNNAFLGAVITKSLK